MEYAVDGVTYEIDFTKDNAEALREVFALVLLPLGYRWVRSVRHGQPRPLLEFSQHRGCGSVPCGSAVQ